MSSSETTAAPAGQSLAYKELNAGAGKKTILFIHGGCTSGDEWDKGASHLSQDYHILQPDLPAHGKSAHIKPYSRQLAASLLADLLREKALDGKAHVVGFSMGANVAVELVSKFPERVDVLFVAGFDVFSSPRMMANALWLQDAIPRLVPQSAMRWFMGGDMEKSEVTKRDSALYNAIAESMCFGDDEWPSPWKARTLIVAAGKAGILPTADNPDNARRLRDIASKAQPPGQTKAYTHPELRHPWPLQKPELLAETTRMWIEESRVPEGFVEL